MGLNNKTYQLFLNALDNFVEEQTNKTCLELGIQEFVDSKSLKYVKDTMSCKFKYYISVDLHKIEGVTQCDLSIYQENLFKCDVLTNFGTSEHVEYEEGQYNCWKNIHNWTNINGFSIHLIPEVGSWRNHCRYFTDFNFFKNLENYGYKIMEFKQHADNNGNLDYCVLKKTSDIPFMSYEEFYKYMKFDNSVSLNLIPSSNNPKNLK